MKWTKEKLIAFENEILKQFEQGKINCPHHACRGNEEQLITLFGMINLKKDWIISHHRNLYHYLLGGGDPNALMAELRGTEDGVCKGYARSMHLIDLKHRFLSTAIVAGGCAIACGIALAIKKKYRGRKVRPHVWCFIGDGAEDSGHFLEAMRFGHSRQLPLTFVIEDNDLAVESTKRDRWHNYVSINAPNVIRYEYVRGVPHVGVGKHISF